MDTKKMTLSEKDLMILVRSLELDVVFWGDSIKQAGNSSVSRVFEMELNNTCELLKRVRETLGE